MSTTTRPVVPDSTHATADQLPWPALLVLGAATLVMVTGEMLPTAVLPQMSAGLGVSESAAGLLVSIWAAVVVIASFPLVRLTRGARRTSVIAASLLVFSVAAAATALAPTYAVVLVARTAGAASVGLLWSTVNAHVADLVPDRLLGRATAVVLGGATLGMVLGTPVGRFVADLAGWRASFWALAVLSLVGAGLVRAVVPDADPLARSAAGAGSGGRRTVRPMVVVTVLVGLVLVGHYGAYTFITRLGEPAATLVPGGMGGLLLVFGLSSAAGVALAGRVLGRTAPALVVATAATAVAVLGFSVTGQSALAGAAVVVLWGVASGALPPLAQTMILRLAGPEHRSLAGALIPVVFNGGIAIGAAFASGVVARGGAEGLPIPAAALIGLAAAGLAVVSRPR
ncbi:MULTISPECIES: MFS transporter [unclassified Nocardioides]|uniref:MFS transporter n=1 Tax=unclassified Nocardioides TaxID=2615069 RepID=UPI0006F35C0C|nr:MULTISPECIES: MFS transporter [unclassified Nocardioides]KRA32707.1 MFS transporter [Nocardioides sp. Root614]KRA89359.1 MFS transporter [Nocardioides sp. Root682]